MSHEQAATSRWIRSVHSNQSAAEYDPRRVEPLVQVRVFVCLRCARRACVPDHSLPACLRSAQALVEMFERNGVHMPLQRVGPGAYTLSSSSRAAVRVVMLNGRLVVRSGAGASSEITAWLERQPLRAAVASAH